MRLQYCSLISRAQELETRVAANSTAASTHIYAAMLPVFASLGHLAINNFDLSASMDGAALPLNIMGAFITAVNTRQAATILFDDRHPQGR